VREVRRSGDECHAPKVPRRVDHEITRIDWLAIRKAVLALGELLELVITATRWSRIARSVPTARRTRPTEISMNTDDIR
jgi:hypothetical protein